MDDRRFDKVHSGDNQSFTLDAVPSNFMIVQERVRDFLAPASCSMRTLLELDMLVEEIFINIASYAYGDKPGSASIDLSRSGSLFTITFRDKGIPYNPLAKDAPDLTSDASNRPVGGLGIFLVQKYSDDMSYEYKDNENRLTIHKTLS